MSGAAYMIGRAYEKQLVGLGPCSESERASIARLVEGRGDRRDFRAAVLRYLAADQKADALDLARGTDSSLPDLWTYLVREAAFDGLGLLAAGRALTDSWLHDVWQDFLTPTPPMPVESVVDAWRYVVRTEIDRLRAEQQGRAAATATAATAATLRAELLRLTLFVEYVLETDDDFDQKLERAVLDRAWKAIGSTMDQIGTVETPADIRLERTRLLDELEQLERSAQARIFAEVLKRAGLED